ncbi:MAG: ImmA/IrrE family metallo-endopeptidase [Asticcacaulis sp.]|uniref:ImmA/IrrE family metallo-endopeptidase n=1 Tax=Asticcacaulis sp. TaxID=1872648 RepID=UPI0039E2BBE6
MNWLHEISDLVQHYVDLPAVDVPDVLAGASYKQLRDEDLDIIAVELRRHWQLGEGPCPDMIALLERIGVIVSTIEMGTSKLDGLCSWSRLEDRPHILLATDKMCYPRRQMDAAHELAHAILHRNVSEDELRDNLKAIEAQAFRLASAFLMPSTTYPLDVFRPSLATLQTLKERWRVSIKAQIRRLVYLDMIPPEHALQMYKLYSAKGWNSEEPLDKLWAVSEPRLLRDSLQLIVESGTRTKEDLASVEFTMAGEDIERLTSLPFGWFTSKAGEVVQLKPQLRDRATGTDGVVVPFRRNS